MIEVWLFNVTMKYNLFACGILTLFYAEMWNQENASTDIALIPRCNLVHSGYCSINYYYSNNP